MPLLHLSRCPVCRVNASTVHGCCAACYRELFRPRLEGNTASLGVYEGKLERAVRAFKFHGAARLGILFGRELAHLIAPTWTVDTVCAVPLHWRRLLSRGYNQSAVLARAMTSSLDKPYRPLLSRHRATRQQARLSRKERLNNVAGAFRLRRSHVLAGQSVLLVDDVMTSGATTEACVTVLRQAGARSVKVAVIARAN